MKNILVIILLLISPFGFSQVENTYQVSFENAVHHEAQIKAVFTKLSSKTVSLRMSRTSPGRYALHEFAKNIYDVKITDSTGKELTIHRPNPHQWDVSGHDGTIHVSYTLFADRGDGTYSQIDETHAHLNIPSAFMYIADLQERPVQVTFLVRDDLQWKVATQLKSLGNNSFSAPNLYYFMDSPIEISNYTIREFVVPTQNQEYKIQLALHHDGTEEEATTFFEQIKKVIEQEKAVFGEYPVFDHGEYTFLTCYMPNVSRDGMEHRNSTIVTHTQSLSGKGMKENMGTITHEFFHSWNVERLRPQSLEPFDFEKANISESLWFAEGFTSYYTDLIMCRAGIISQDEYLKRLTNTYNYVWNSPALQYFNPIEMSYQAPFVDAATSVDPVNRKNTFISYYSYGSMLGLALDLSLRNLKKGVHLDGYMKLLWDTYGKAETPYNLEHLRTTLQKYAGEAFANDFFTHYILDSKTPDFVSLFKTVGIQLTTAKEKATLGAKIDFDIDNIARINEYTSKGSPAYTAGLEKGDVILAIDTKSFTNLTEFENLIEHYTPDDSITISYQRLGRKKETKVNLGFSSDVTITAVPKPRKKIIQQRADWLNPR